MTQSQINREVAHATGETVEFIRQRGFGIVIVPRQQDRPRGNGGQTQAKQSKPVPAVQQPRTAA
jgi:hypothetical protein